MVFLCQKDSFLTEFDTQIVTCEEVTETSELKNVGADNGQVHSNKVFRVILEDTILFPEGGGQPDDRGTIGDKDVIRCIRKGTQAVHYIYVSAPTTVNEEKGHNNDTTIPFQVGDKVTAKIDWKRRFDHMQQHSGQHLITAITDALYGYSTTSWWLGTEECNIELDTKDLLPEQISKIEEEVNLKIRQALPVTVDVVELDDPKLKIARGRNLPDDVKGQIRIVTMSGVESNVCCGTHVTNLSQLQVIKLLHVIKKKGKCLLHFLSGNRVLDRFAQQFQREQLLMGVLKCSPPEFPTAAEKLNVALKSVRKSCVVLSKDLASLEARKLTENGETPNFWAYHRDNVDLDFANALLRELGSPKSSVLLITIKTDGSSGHMFVVGAGLEKEKLSNLGDTLCKVLDGKGNVRGTVYQAKVNKINNVKKAVTLAQDIVGTLIDKDQVDAEK